MDTSTDNPRFAGKVAFVTGAGSGIGRATALAFAREHASVVVADISEEGNRRTARLIEGSGGRVLAVTCDVTRAEDVKAALNRTVDTFGRLDVAFNNAGVEQPTTATADVTEQEWQRIIGSNLTGVLLCLKYEIPLLLAARWRRDREHLLGRRSQRLPRSSRLLRSEARRHRSHQGGGPRLPVVQHPDQRHLPRDRRHPMMQRFSGGTPEGREAVIAQEPIGRMGTPRRSPRPCCGCARTPRPSLSATLSSSTAAKRCK